MIYDSTKRLTKEYPIEDYNDFVFSCKEIGIKESEIEPKPDYVCADRDAGIFPILDKLGKFEDIEQKFGIDLVKLLSADRIYIKGEKEPFPFDLNIPNKAVLVYSNNELMYIFYPDTYGTEWAFTREELE